MKIEIVRKEKIKEVKFDMNRNASLVLPTLIVNFALSFFGVFVYRDEAGAEYCNYWQGASLSDNPMLSILLGAGALYVLIMYFFSQKGAHITCCLYPVVEIIGLSGLKGELQEICWNAFGSDNVGFSFWGWLMIITAIILFFELGAASRAGSN